MEDLTFQQTYQNITANIGEIYIAPLVLAAILISSLYIFQNSSSSIKMIQIIFSIEYIYSGIFYCHWFLLVLHLFYCFILTINLESLRNYKFSLKTQYLQYNHSGLALLLPLLVLFSMFLPNANYFPSPYLLSAYTYCIVNRFTLVIKNEKNKDFIRVHVRLI